MGNHGSVGALHRTPEPRVFVKSKTNEGASGEHGHLNRRTFLSAPAPLLAWLFLGKVSLATWYTLMR